MDKQTALEAIFLFIIDGFISHDELVELAGVAYAKEAADDAESDDE